jgi:two-component system nitrate/nitrite sensor histidine kinase NarX
VTPAALADQHALRNCARCAALASVSKRRSRATRSVVIGQAKAKGDSAVKATPVAPLRPFDACATARTNAQTAAALAAIAAQWDGELRRLALHEQRSAIARELHDSIALSRSYTKIQLARLAALLPAVQAAQAQAVLAELRTGVAVTVEEE